MLPPCALLARSSAPRGYVGVEHPAFEISCVVPLWMKNKQIWHVAPPNAHGYLASSRDHKGTKITVSGGTELYSTGALGSSGRAILICPDIWGWDSGRLRNIADHLADAGYLVVVPKILQPAWVTTPACVLSLCVHISQAQWRY